MTPHKDDKDLPWYKNYMLVMVLALPAIMVVICIIFVIWSIKVQDSTVRDDWYMDGKALFQDASLDQRAYDIGVAGIMRFAGNQVMFDLNYPKEALTTQKLATGAAVFYPKRLHVLISHATNKEFDKEFELVWTKDNHYVGEVHLSDVAAKYYLTIKPLDVPDGEPWRLITHDKLPAKHVVFVPLQSFAHN